MNKIMNNILYRLVMPVSLVLLCLLPGCRNEVDVDGYYVIKPVSDPLVLEYEFVPEVKKFAFHSDYYIPMNFTDDSLTNICLIMNDWQSLDIQTAVIFFNDIGMNLALHQVNLPTLAVDGYYVYDFDNNQLEDIALIYRVKDSLWLQIIDSRGNVLYKKYLLTGKDSNGNGYWDGYGFITTVYDINNDGRVEIFAGCDTGYDLYPRKLMCLDWVNDTLLWEFNVSGVTGKGRNFVLPLGNDARPSVVIFVQSKGNAAVVDDMTDLFSYLIVLDENGRLKWKTKLGGVFSRAVGIPFDYNSDGTVDILTGVAFQDSALQADTATVTSSKLVVFDHKGEILCSQDVGIGGLINTFLKFDYAGGRDNAFFMTLSDKRLLAFDAHFNILKKCKFYACNGKIAYGDFLNNGYNQILTAFDGKLWLLDDDFEVLAQYGASEFKNMTFDVFKPDPRYSLNNIILSTGEYSINYVMRLEKTVWYTVFSRKPWLAFLAAFVPLSIIILVTWYILAVFRQKNILIKKQHDQLNVALVELKETQDKLIAAEKYRQAKDIAGGFAHEIRNALFPAKSALNYLKQLKKTTVVNSNMVYKYAKITDQAIAKAVNITRLISQYTRLDDGYKPEPVDIMRIVEELKHNYEAVLQENDIKLIINNNTAPVQVTSNREQLYLVLNNLILNSLDALTNRPEPSIFISIEEDNDFLVLTFKDNGCGITRENLNRIFNTFFSTKPDKGTGLGLALAKKIVEMYGGVITVESEIDKGTLFKLKLKLFVNSL